jgi:hypothetical protein
MADRTTLFVHECKLMENCLRKSHTNRFAVHVHVSDTRPEIPEEERLRIVFNVIAELIKRQGELVKAGHLSTWPYLEAQLMDLNLPHVSNEEQAQLVRNWRKIWSRSCVLNIIGKPAGRGVDKRFSPKHNNARVEIRACEYTLDTDLHTRLLGLGTTFIRLLTDAITLSAGINEHIQVPENGSRYLSATRVLRTHRGSAGYA